MNPQHGKRRKVEKQNNISNKRLQNESLLPQKGDSIGFKLNKAILKL